MSALTDQAEYEGLQFNQLNHQNEALSQIEFFDCTFKNCLFREVTFDRCQFYACEFRDCDLSLVSWLDCSFQNGRFYNTKLIGINWTQLKWSKFVKESPLYFEACVLDYGTFIGQTIHKQMMVGCSLKEVDFSEADLTQASFVKSDLTQTQFRHTNLTQADFQKAKNYNINIQQNTVNKAQFSMPEAIALLHSLDIKLMD